MTANIKQLVLFELLYKGLFALLMLPLLEYSLRFAIKFSGYSYITPENIFSVLKKPATLCVVVLLLLILFLFSFLELVSLMVFFHASEEHHPLKVRQILFPGVKKACQMLKRKNLFGLITAVVLFTVVSNIPLWIRFCGNVSILPFLAAGFLSLFTLYEICFQGLGFRAGIRQSFRRMVSHRGKTAGTVLLWNSLFFVMEAVGFLLVLLLFVLLVELFVPQARRFAFFLVLIEGWNLYGGMFAATIGFVAEVAMLSGIFHDRTAQEETVELCDTTGEDVSFEKVQKESRILRALTILVVIGNIVNVTIMFRQGSVLEHEIWQNIAITAHRGASMEAPENTLSALELAIENLADYAEIDVQETKDGEVILLHDTSLKRTTGEKKDIWNAVYEEVYLLDCGSWFSPRYAGERIPTLAEALELCKGRIYLNIELKGTTNSRELEQKVVHLIEEYGFENQCVITSKNYDSLRKIKALNENLKTGYILSAVYGNFYEKEGIDLFSMKAAFVTREIVEKAHRFGKEVHVWTVNSRSEMERMKLLGVDNIITDNPLLAREVIEGEEILETLFGLLWQMMKN